MSSRSKCFSLVVLLVSLLLSPALQAVNLEEIRRDAHLTPENIAKYFADFEFKFHEEVQDWDVFLATKSGDCDDFATLAADVLTKKGYSTRLVAVRMKGETHVVCYVAELHGYLDYNCRKDPKPFVSCSNKITDIAREVAKSFGRDWVATYEFTYAEKVKRLVDKIVTNRSLNSARRAA